MTIMRMNAGWTPAILCRPGKCRSRPDETGGSLFDRLAACGAELLIETLPSVEDGTAVYTPQPEESPTPYASMISRESGCIDWSAEAAQIERLVRAMNPWPAAWTVLDGKTLKIWHAGVEKPDLEGEEGKTGFIVRQDARGLYVQTGRGILVPGRSAAGRPQAHVGGGVSKGLRCEESGNRTVLKRIRRLEVHCDPEVATVSSPSCPKKNGGSMGRELIGYNNNTVKRRGG